MRAWLAIPLGAGIALTLDEAAILLEREDVYWSNEQLPILTLLSALTGALGLASRFLVRGARLTTS